MSSELYTAIISDLHLCEAEPLRPKFPLWKKFKTKEFFIDQAFKEFLQHIQSKAEGKKIELVLNGDIFDFDSILTLPDRPAFKVHLIEKHRGLLPREERSEFKIEQVISDHEIFFSALKDFLSRGNNVVFVIGNHDLEMHFEKAQKALLRALDPNRKHIDQIRICEWFYISHQDTLIEHGNQYDPYCVCEDPVNPYVKGYNHISLKLPFGNLACRYIMNGLGFFNPHVDSNYIMGMKEYITIFLRYMAKAQPFLIGTWFIGALLTLGHSFIDRLSGPIRNPLGIEDRIEKIAKRANATPRMVREMKELFVEPAASNPFLLMRELWLDRAFIILIVFYLIFMVLTAIRAAFDISFFWAFLPLFLFLPFFLFYSKSITSLVSGYKEPDEKILSMIGAITNVSRVVFGHTHHPRHELIGPIEHLNSGCWSPAFLDIECTKPIDQKTFVWIFPDKTGSRRQAQLMRFYNGTSEILGFRSRQH